jgi:hypothetical protein
MQISGHQNAARSTMCKSLPVIVSNESEQRLEKIKSKLIWGHFYCHLVEVTLTSVGSL